MKGTSVPFILINIGMNPNLAPEYKAPDEGTRHNWYESELITFPDGSSALAHRHLNGGGWVADTAFVANTVIVKPAGVVFGNARVFGYAIIEDNSAVYDDAVVFGTANIGNGTDTMAASNNAVVFGNVSAAGGPADAFSVTASEGRVFGEVVLQADTGIVEGADAGDVFGTYSIIGNDNGYHDTTFGEGPQIHGTAIGGDGTQTLNAKKAKTPPLTNFPPIPGFLA